jgi:diaminopimelate decarboxylase
LVCFSVKSLANLTVIKFLAELGSGFDVVSGGELYRVIQAGAAPSRAVYAGVGKTRAEIEYALRSGVHMFNVESAAEMLAINDVATDLDRTAPVAIRVNPDVDARTHAKTTTGKKENKFGVSISAARTLGIETSEMDGVDLQALHVHLGSPIYSTEPYVEALRKVAELRRELEAAGCTIRAVNLGGGYCMSYTGEPVIGPQDYAEAVGPVLEKMECRVIIEPGRHIAAPAGILLVGVTYNKQRDYGKKFVICDGGMNDLMRPTLYEAFHRIWPVENAGGMPSVMQPDAREYEGFATEIVDVVGPICESGDYLAKQRPLPPTKEGDVLAVFDAGAYGFTMSSTYNAQPRPPEVLVRDGAAHLVRERETYEDLVRSETESL